MYIEGIHAYGYEDYNGGQWPDVPMTDSSASMFLYMLREEKEE
jgi:hypothetical protein